MNDNFRINKPFDPNPPQLKDMVNDSVMGDVWVRDTPFGPVTDSLKIAEKFEMNHSHVLRSIKKCERELATESKFGLCNNIIKTDI